MAYVDLAGNEAVTGIETRDAVATGVFSVKVGQTIPNTAEELTKSEIYDLIDIEPFDGSSSEGFAGYELVTKEELIAIGELIASNITIPKNFNPYIVFGNKYNYQLKGAYTIPGLTRVEVPFNYQPFGSNNTSVAVRSPNVSTNFFYVASSTNGVGVPGDDSYGGSGGGAEFYKIGGFNIEKIRAAYPSVTQMTCEYHAKRVVGPSWNRQLSIRGDNNFSLNDQGYVNGNVIGGNVLYGTTTFDASVALKFSFEFLTSTTCNIRMSRFTTDL